MQNGYFNQHDGEACQGNPKANLLTNPQKTASTSKSRYKFAQLKTHHYNISSQYLTYLSQLAVIDHSYMLYYQIIAGGA